MLSTLPLKATAGLLAATLLAGCALFNTYAIAAHEVNDLDEFGSAWCWARSLLDPCADDQAAEAMSDCVRRLGKDNGYIHARQRSRTELIACMKTRGWYRIERYVMVY